MARYLLMTLSEASRRRRLFPIVERLVERGASVAWRTGPADAMTLPDMRSLAGVTLLTDGGEDTTPPTTREPTRQQRPPAGTSQAHSDERGPRNWLALYLPAVPSLVQKAQEDIRRVRPDAVLADAGLFHVAIASELEHVKHAAVGALEWFPPQLPDYPYPEHVALYGARQACVDSFHVQVPFANLFHVSPYLNLSFGTPAFVGPDANRIPKLAFLGGYRRKTGDVSDLLQGLEADRPLVFVSFGTQYQHATTSTQDRVVGAAVAAGANVVLSTASPLSSSFPPSRVRVFDWVDQPSLLARSHLFVTHGGGNSVLEALEAGVPMLVMLGKRMDGSLTNDFIDGPADTVVQAHFIKARGCGEVLCCDAPQADIEATMRQLLAPTSPARSVATAMRDNCGEFDAARDGTAALEMLAASADVRTHPL